MFTSQEVVPVVIILIDYTLYAVVYVIVHVHDLWEYQKPTVVILVQPVCRGAASLGLYM